MAKDLDAYMKEHGVDGDAQASETAGQEQDATGDSDDESELDNSGDNDERRDGSIPDAG